jgi:hypothetical protein
MPLFRPHGKHVSVGIKVNRHSTPRSLTFNKLCFLSLVPLHLCKPGLGYKGKSKNSSNRVTCQTYKGQSPMEKGGESTQVPRPLHTVNQTNFSLMVGRIKKGGGSSFCFPKFICTSFHNRPSKTRQKRGECPLPLLGRSHCWFSNFEVVGGTIHRSGVNPSHLRQK